MENKENAIIIYDIALLVFGVVAGWFLLFQSGVL